MAENNTKNQVPSAEVQLGELIAKFEPKNQELIRSVRGVLRKRFPTVNELVYDYAKSLVISYAPNERGSDGIVAISADDKGVRLFINHGISLPDPNGLLLGDGRQTRYIHVESDKDLLRPGVQELLTAAAGKVGVAPTQTGKGEIIIKTSKKAAKSATAKPDGSKRKDRGKKSEN